MDQEQEWRNILLLYENLSAEGHDEKPLADLVRKIAKTNYSKIFYPSTSHYTLCLSQKEDYEESLNHPLICIKYLKDEEFQVSYVVKPKQTHNILKRICHSSEIWSYLESLLLRLKLESEIMKSEEPI